MSRIIRLRTSALPREPQQKKNPQKTQKHSENNGDIRDSHFNVEPATPYVLSAEETAWPKRHCDALPPILHLPDQLKQVNLQHHPLGAITRNSHTKTAGKARD
jgi:hypothetical protein